MEFRTELMFDTQDPRLIRFLEHNDLETLFRFLVSQYIDDLWLVLETPDRPASGSL